MIVVVVTSFVLSPSEHQRQRQFSVLYSYRCFLILKYILEQEYVNSDVPALFHGSYCLIPPAHALLHESTHTSILFSTDVVDSCFVSGRSHLGLLDCV
jgi:hypothetical protein